MTAPLPPNEPERLRALHATGILDTPPEAPYDDVVRLTAAICGTPIAAVSFIDGDRLWLKARHGIEMREMPRDGAPCSWCILTPDRLTVIPDARADERFASSPLVTGEPRIRFYAGMPLVTLDGHAIGALCAIDRQPRTLTDQQAEALKLLARQLVLQFELARQLADKRTTEEALRESRERFEKAFDGSPIAKALVGLDGNWLQVNPAFCRMVGYSAEELLGHSFEDITHPQDRVADAERMRRLQATGESVASADKRYIHRDGHTVWVHVSASTVWDSEGKPRYFVSEIQDVTERKQTETILERYRLLASIPRDMILFVDQDARVIEANAAACAGYGYAREELIGMRVRSLRAPGTDHAQMDAAIANGIAHGTLVEAVHQRKDGSTFPAEVSAQPARMGDQEIAIDVVRDITVRKEIEAALRESERRTREIVDAASDCIISIDAKGCIVEFNPAAERTFGHRREEVIGQPMTELLVTPAMRPVHDVGFDYCLRTGASPFLNRRMELIALHADGHEFPIELTISLTGTNGIPHFTGFARDITAEKAAQASLASALAQAEEASRMKSEFVAAISHELRTPLNGVIGMTGLLLDTELTPLQREFAETARHSSEVLLTLINDLLDFSKIEAGKLSIEPVPFDLRALVESVGDTFAPRADAAGVALILRYAPDAPHYLVGDPGRIRQVLANLVDNAIKFTARGHVLVDVECTGRTNGNVLLQMRVVDTGIGIAPEQLERIFDQFTQADASTTRRYGGTGLGLSISRRLASMMGGTLIAESRPGEGSSFTFVLPLPVATETDIPTEMPLPPCRMLVADDNPVNLRILEEYARSWNLACTTSTSASEALEKARSAAREGIPYDIVLIDHQMPGMDGMEAARAIRSEPALAGTRLVMLTSTDHIREMSQTGSPFDAVLQKPVRQTDLRTTLYLLLTALPAPIPAVEMPRAKPIRPAGPAEPAPSVPNNGGGMRWRVLVAEDNAVNQKVAEHILSRLSCRVDVAANGREAVQMTATFPYDVIFMDCSMPEMDGFEATAAIRNREGADRHTPIFAMTASAMAGDRERCLDAGMDGYLAKPVRSGDFATVIQGLEMPPAPPEKPAASAPRQPVAPPPIDTGSLLNRLGSDPAFLREMARTATEDAGVLIAQIEEAAQVQDAPALERSAHALKGLFLTLDAQPAADAARDLERTAHLVDLAGSAGCITRLRAAVEAALDAFARLCDQMDA